MDILIALLRVFDLRIKLESVIAERNGKCTEIEQWLLSLLYTIHMTRLSALYTTPQPFSLHYIVSAQFGGAFGRASVSPLPWRCPASNFGVWRPLSLNSFISNSLRQ